MLLFYALNDIQKTICIEQCEEFFVNSRFLLTEYLQ